MPGQDAPGTDSPEDDVRLLPGSIMFDEAQMRWRSMVSAVAISFKDEFPDWPINRPRSLFFALLDLRLESKNFLEHHQKWVAGARVHQSDCAVHEHEVCCSALHFGL